MGFQYAIFDMDGLMFDTERLFVESFVKEVGPATGMDFPVEKLKALLGLNRAATEEIFPTLFGTKYTCEQCYEISERWVKEYITENGIPLKPGLEELLIWLKTNGFKCAVATSTARDKAAGYMKSVGLEHYFDAIIGGDMVSKGKPDPQIFQIAAETLGSADPGQCVVFEDSRNGLLAALNAKMAAVIVPDLLDPTVEFPGLCYAKVKTLSDAIAVLKAADNS